MLVQKLKNVPFQTLSVLPSIFTKIISDALSESLTLGPFSQGKPR